MRNGWTGGQYSLFRVVFGTYLFVHFAQLVFASPEQFSQERLSPEGAGSRVFNLLPNVLALSDAPAFVTGMLVAAAGLSLLFVIGLNDRVAALALWYIWACLFGLNPLTANRSFPFVAWLLLAHACLPPSPYGSWSARGRPDPGGSWHMPQPIFLAAWIIMALSYTLLALTDFADWTLGMVMVHLFTFNPAWVCPLKAPTEMIFYDGHCGLCHRLVRLVLAEDRAGDTFRFAPIDSDAFRAVVPESDRAGLPDSVIVRTAEGALLTRSAGSIHILKRLGVMWRLLGWLGAVIPAKISDRIYDGIARIRHRLFRRPVEVCPLIPAQLRARFQI